jgi:hypothetical protein
MTTIDPVMPSPSTSSNALAVEVGRSSRDLTRPPLEIGPTRTAACVGFAGEFRTRMLDLVTAQSISYQVGLRDPSATPG